MARAFAPTLRPPWMVAACTAAGAAAAWIATSAALTPLLLVVRIEGLELRLTYCAWIATTHAVAAVLHRRMARSSALVLWTFAGSTIVPGAFLALLFMVIAGGRVSAALLIEPTLIGLVPSALALPVVAAISAAEREPVPGRALTVLAAGLLVPWTLGGDRAFATALATALTLSAIAIAIAAHAARDSELRVRCVRAGGASYRSAGVIAFTTIEPPEPVKRLSRSSAAAALVVALGLLQLTLLVRGA